MSQFLGSSLFTGNFPVQRNDLSIQSSNYSTRWWAFGPDVLWPRGKLIGQAVGGVGANEINNAMDLWDWELFLRHEGKIGQRRDSISGVTKDQTGTVLGSCDVTLFDVARDEKVDKTTSDATTGAYTLTTPYTGQTVYAVAYKAGTPVAGTTAQVTPS